MRLWARAARALLVCLGRALPLERRFVVLDAVGALRVFVGVLPCHVNSQAVPRVEGFTTILAASTCEQPLRRSRRRGAPDVAQVLLQTLTSEKPFAVRALRVPRRFPHLLSAAVSCSAQRPIGATTSADAASGTDEGFAGQDTARHKTPLRSGLQLHARPCRTTSDKGTERCRCLPASLNGLRGNGVSRTRSRGSRRSSRALRAVDRVSQSNNRGAQAPTTRTTPRRIQGESAVRSEWLDDNAKLKMDITVFTRS